MAYRSRRAAHGADFRKTLHNEWGLALWLELQAGGSARKLMLDFGYSLRCSSTTWR